MGGHLQLLKHPITRTTPLHITILSKRTYFQHSIRRWEAAIFSRNYCNFQITFF